MRDSISEFRIVGIAEGISFLLLLGVAMPLKYLAGMPLGVRIIGAIHGGLFLLYLFASLRAARHAKWPLGRLVEAWIAALLPFGPFVVDRKRKRDIVPSEVSGDA